MGLNDDERGKARARLDEHLQRHGLKQTRQREAILDVFLSSSGHITPEQLYERVREDQPDIGAATVYRTLKLLVEAGVADASTFIDGVTVYEHRHGHHDHLVCLGCNEVLEFKDDVIERQQDEVASMHGYRLTRHRHHLFGYCARCQREGRDREGTFLP